jgi:aldose 1-epimerase
VDESETHVTLAATIVPQDAYPWRVIVETTFALSDDGLTQTVTARNESASPVPFGTGPHPYLVAGTGSVDAWTLELPAGEVLLVTDDRLVPTDLVPVAADAERFDFRAPRIIGAAEIDHAYTGIARGERGRATVRLTDASGSGVRMTWDERCPWVQIHTADLPGRAPGHRAGLAVEPMTCPPDAFNSGTDLLVIAPGATASASWTIGTVTA